MLAPSLPDFHSFHNGQATLFWSLNSCNLTTCDRQIGAVSSTQLRQLFRDETPHAIPAIINPLVGRRTIHPEAI